MFKENGESFRHRYSKDYGCLPNGWRHVGLVGGWKNTGLRN